MQVTLEGEKLIGMVMGSLVAGLASEAMPEKETVPLIAGNEPVTVSLNMPEPGAVKESEPVTGNPLVPDEFSIRYVSVY